MDEEITQMISEMLQGAFEQGKAAQRVEDAQAEFSEKADTVNTNWFKLRQYLGLDKEEDEPEKKVN